jgi:predicted phosphoribosyltransferase
MRPTAAPYADRAEAGDQLADSLLNRRDRDDVVVVGLTRGGVPVAARIAAALNAPLDVMVVRKLGVPGAPEVAFGAVGPGGIAVHNPAVEAHVSPAEAEKVTRAESEELERRERRYRGGRAALDLTGREAIIVDDGLATGATARAAVAVARRLGAARVVVAAPVGATEAVALLRNEADEVVCPVVPPTFGAVSRFYLDFPQTTDDEVVTLLADFHHA